MQVLKLILVALIVTMFSGTTAAANEIPWENDLGRAMTRAAQENKPVLIHFWSTTCPPCRKLDQYVFTHPAVARSIEANCIPVKVNVTEQPGVAQRYGIKYIPHDVFVSPTGQQLWSTSSPSNADGYMAMINRVASNSSIQRDPQLDEVTRTAQQQSWDRAERGAFDARGTAGATSAPSQQTDPRYDSSQPQQQPYAPDTRFNPMPHSGSAQAASSPYGQRSAAPVGVAGWQSSNNAPVPGGGSFTGGGSSTAGNQSGFVVERGENGFNAANYRDANPPGGMNQAQPPSYSDGQNWNAQQNQFTPNPYIDRGASAPSRPAAEPAKPSAEPKLALDGFCPVTLLQQQSWKRGDSKFGAVHRGRLYLFVGEAEFKTFWADPDAYSPALAGYDPVALVEGNQWVEGQRKHGVFYRVRPTDPIQIYLFNSEDSLNRFSMNPVKYSSDVHQAMMQNRLGNR